MIRARLTAGEGRFILIGGACFLLAIGCWAATTSLASKRHSYNNLVQQVEQMNQDTVQIQALREAPRLAADRERPNDELLAQVRDSLTSAGIAPERWIGNDPASPIRVPKSPYKRFAVRLLFDEVTLRQLIQFAHHLVATDPTLAIPTVRLFAPAGIQKEVWNVDLTLSYLIYSPHEGE